MAPLAEIVVELPLHTAPLPDVTTFGRAVTVTAIVLVALQPPLVPVTVYVMFDNGLVVTFAPDVALSAVAGDHAYEPAPLTVNDVDEPEQTDVELLPPTTGKAVTLMFWVAVSPLYV